MRLVLVLLAVVGACKDDKSAPRDAAVDALVYRDAGIDAPLCAPTGACPNGPACGSGCCGSGEYCASGTCMCGTGSSCTDGNSCMSGGPLVQTYCGSICCGATLGCPVVK